MIDLAEPSSLCAALLDSRQRWQEFGAIAADFAFETDRVGRLTFMAPDTVLGWSGSDLLGQPAARLLADRWMERPDPFCLAVPVRQRPTWLLGADGIAACFAISSVPLLDGMGRIKGTRGVGVDVTARERADDQTAAALRRGEVLDHILSQVRQEVLAPRMMEAVLAALMRALNALGAAVLDLSEGQQANVPYAVGADPAAVVVSAEELLQGQQLDSETSTCLTDSGLQVLACPASTRFGEQVGLILWRHAEARPWDANDHTLAASVTGVIRIVLEHESIQRHLALQTRTDPLTGLLNRGAFLDEAARRIDRLDREELPGVLMRIDLDQLRPLNAQLGHDADDATLLLTAALLRKTFRPTDLVARLGGNEFALWLDGSDELTAAERAEGLRLGFPLEVAAAASAGNSPSLSTGIACRQPGTYEELDTILHRAGQALYDAKRAGLGQWRVSHLGALR